MGKSSFFNEQQSRTDIYRLVTSSTMVWKKLHRRAVIDMSPALPKQQQKQDQKDKHKLRA